MKCSKGVRNSLVNQVFVVANKISAVFGRENFRDYIGRQVHNQNLVRIKNRSIQSSERNALIAKGYRENASTDSNLTQEAGKVNRKNSLSDENTDLAPMAEDV